MTLKWRATKPPGREKLPELMLVVTMEGSLSCEVILTLLLSVEVRSGQKFCLEYTFMAKEVSW